MSDSLQPHGLYPSRLPCSWDSPGKNIGVGRYSLSQGIFPAQGSNPGLHCRQILYHLSYQGNPFHSVIQKNSRIQACRIGLPNRNKMTSKIYTGKINVNSVLISIGRAPSGTSFKKPSCQCRRQKRVP